MPSPPRKSQPDHTAWLGGAIRIRGKLSIGTGFPRCKLDCSSARMNNSSHVNNRSAFAAVVILRFTIFLLFSHSGLKCVDTAIPSCYFSTGGKFFSRTLLTEARQTGTMSFVAKKIFLTKGVGKHPERLSSFEVALPNAGIAACNIVRVSSIFPPNCKLISRSEGLKHIKPGQVAFTVISENSTKEAH